MSDSVDKVEVLFMNRVSTFDFHDDVTVHDRVLLVEGKKFYVQSGLLAGWSDFFRTLFNSEFKEKNEAEIELEDVSADGFGVFLQLIYPVFFDLKGKHIESLITLSHRFLAPHVLAICMKFIDKEFDKIDKIMLYRVAAMHDMGSLKEKALNSIMKNIESLNLIRLLKLAFDHNLDDLKATLRHSICTAKRVRKCYECSLMRIYCTHNELRMNPLTYNSLIDVHIYEIMDLPADIQSFVLFSTVNMV